MRRKERHCLRNWWKIASCTHSSSLTYTSLKIEAIRLMQSQSSLKTSSMKPSLSTTGRRTFVSLSSCTFCRTTTKTIWKMSSSADARVSRSCLTHSSRSSCKSKTRKMMTRTSKRWKMKSRAKLSNQERKRARRRNQRRKWTENCNLWTSMTTSKRMLLMQSSLVWASFATTCQSPYWERIREIALSRSSESSLS